MFVWIRTYFFAQRRVRACMWWMRGGRPAIPRPAGWLAGWLSGGGFGQVFLGGYSKKLRKEGYVEVADLVEADDDDLAKLIAKLKLKTPEARRLRKLIASNRPAEEEEEESESVWTYGVDEDGDAYYYNSETEQTVYEREDEDGNTEYVDGATEEVLDEEELPEGMLEAAGAEGEGEEEEEEEEGGEEDEE
eukprot:SAG25_NODE_519_length_7241_cov_159.775553_3_plen_191_part_00